MSWFSTQYLKGHKVLSSREIVDFMFRDMDSTLISPHKTRFTRLHIYDSQPDSFAIALDYKMLQRFVENYSRSILPWHKNTGDCDSITLKFFADMARGVEKTGFEYGLAGNDLWYLSNWVKQTPNSKWSGYHSAPYLLYMKDKEIKSVILQPATENHDHVWLKTKKESRGWVNAVGAY